MGKMQINAQSDLYPLPEQACKKDKWKAAIPALYMMGSTSLMGIYISNFLSIFAAELNSVPYLAIMSLVYTLGVSTAAPIGGYLGDAYGRRNMALMSCAVLVAGIMLAARASSLPAFLLGLALWGIANGFDETFYNGMLCDIFQGKDRTFFLGVANSFNAGAIMLSSVVSGYLMKTLRPQVVLAIAGSTIVVGWLLLFIFGQNIKTNVAAAKFDWKGSVFLIVALGAICTLLSAGGKYVPWISLESLLLTAAAIGGMICLFYSYKKSENPIIDFRLFRIKYFLPVIFLVSFNKLQGPITVYIMSYANLVLKYSTSQLGNTQFLTLIPVAISPLIAKWLAESKKFTVSFLISGILLTMQGLLMYVFITPETPYYVFVALRGLGNLATVFVMGPSIAFVATFIPKERRGVCLGLYTTIAYVATALLNSLGGLIYNFYNADIEIAFPKIALICGVLAIGSIFITVKYMRNPT